MNQDKDSTPAGPAGAEPSARRVSEPACEGRAPRRIASPDPDHEAPSADNGQASEPAGGASTSSPDPGAPSDAGDAQAVAQDAGAASTDGVASAAGRGSGGILPLTGYSPDDWPADGDRLSPSAGALSSPGEQALRRELDVALAIIARLETDLERAKRELGIERARARELEGARNEAQRLTQLMEGLHRTLAAACV